ncbi:sulfatase [Stieleria marina]|uniref:Choline-sulfatase n=1 Tax=Stieleria marina TaxID=1930275 RepID=A0A517NXB4_9BACT|nr:Choline-sulfatase [Planctomycetes bacterium K23_9]
MNQRQRLRPLASSFAVCLLAMATTLVAAEKPNLVFIIADDCTFDDFGCYGGQAHTPNIDKLATEGMQFMKCFQAAPMCSPTRHNIYTGLYPVKSGAYPNHTFAKNGIQSIVHYLQPLGYRVALSGKTHIGPKEAFPFEYSVDKKNPDLDAVSDLMEQSKQSETPFCLFACSNEPHTPWDKGDASKYPPAEIKLPPYIVDTPVVRDNFSRYLAEITYYDDQVGQILHLLDQHNLKDNTLVMVVSEQGNSFPFAKWTCYGHGLQSAMIVRWPGKVAAGATTDAIVEYTDITPTFVQAAGGKPSDLLDGKSFVDVLMGKTTTHKSFAFGEMTTRGIINGSDAYAIRTVRDARYRLVWNLNHESKFTNACTKADYFQSMVAKASGGDKNAKMLVDRYHYRPEFELFDCEADPMEMNNLASDPAHKETLVRLKVELDRWMDQQGDIGLETELDALSRQSKYRSMTRKEAVEAWRTKGNGSRKPAKRKLKKNKASK